MEDNAVKILQQLSGQYDASTNYLLTGSIAIAKEIFYSIALISIALFGYNQLLRKGSDLADTNLDLVKWLIYLIFLFAFIDNFQQIFSVVFSWIEDIADYLGYHAANLPQNNGIFPLKPENIFAIGIRIAKKMIVLNFDLNIFKVLVVALLSVACAAVVLFCFTVIGLELLLVQIGCKIILAGGIFLLGFGGLQWTKDYAERYVHTFFHVGIKMIFIYILIGIGISLSQNWVSILVLDAKNLQLLIDSYLSIALASYVYYKLCTKIPDQAVSWLTGRFALGFDTAADVKSAASSSVKAGKYLEKKGEETVTNMAGNAKAYDAAQQMAKASFMTQAKTPTQQEFINETLKTLGQANRNMKQAERDKVVGDTEGGKLSKAILDEIPTVNQGSNI